MFVALSADVARKFVRTLVYMLGARHVATPRGRYWYQGVVASPGRYTLRIRSLALLMHYSVKNDAQQDSAARSHDRRNQEQW